MKTGIVYKVVAVGIVIVALVWQCIGAWQDSQTTDEAVHLTAGRSYWQLGDFRLNPEHPSLFKLWAALPLLLLPNSAVQTDTEFWASGNEWLIGAQYHYGGTAQNIYGARWLIFWGRVPMILLWLGFAVLLCRWAWRRWGPWPALASTALFVFDPNLLGHGHLITNDIATAFVLWGVCMAIDWFTLRPSWRRLLWLATCFSLGLLTKFSLVTLWVLVPTLLAVAVRYRRPVMDWRWWWRSLAAFALTALVMGWAAYGFHAPRIGDDPRIADLWRERAQLVNTDTVATLPPIMQTVVHLTAPDSTVGNALQALERIPLPAYWYWRGLFSAATHNLYGHQAYIFGQASTLGWWYYFPVAVAFKTPLLLLALVFAAAVMCIRTLATHLRPGTAGRWPIEWWFYIAPPLAYFLWSMTSHLNIGLRHVFPTYAFFPLAAGWVLWHIYRRRPSWSAPISTTIIIGCFLVSLVAWPNTIGYFNALAGGTRSGHRILLDSNLDWNQDIWRLRSFIDRHGFEEVHLALFGSIPTINVFPELAPILRDEEVAQGAIPRGIVAISKGLLYLPESPFSWLRLHEPRWTIGSSVLVYDFR